MSRSTLLSILICAMLVTGLFTLNGQIIAFTIPLVVYLMMAAVYRPESPQLTAVRDLDDDQVSQGKPVPVNLTIRNQGMALEEVLLEDVVPPELKILDGSPTLFTTIEAGETLTLEYLVQGQRGSFDFDALRVRASDHLDLFRRKMTLSAPGRFLILPEVRKLGRVAIRPFRTRLHTGLNPSRQGGFGTDFFGVRSYQPGDPLHVINWKLSARHSRGLYANEFESERIADIGIILDARTRNEIKIGEHSLFNHAIRATASLADAFLGGSNRVSMLVYGRTLQRTFPGYGKLQRQRILQTLAQAKTGDSEVFDRLDYLPVRFFPAKSQLVFISPLSSDDLLTLRRLRALGYHLMVISPDPVSFEASLLPATPETQTAARIAAVERNLVLHQIKRLGILVVDWQVDTPLEHTVLASLNMMTHWMRSMESMT